MRRLYVFAAIAIGGMATTDVAIAQHC